MAKFTHLHFHSDYTLLKSSNKIKDIIPTVKEMGMDSFAITDIGNMFGVIDFYKIAKEEGVTPILGIELSIGKDKSNNLCLYAKNIEGYNNLMYLSSQAFLNTDKKNDSPFISTELLEKYSQGILVISPEINGQIATSLRSNNKDEARKFALEYKKIFQDDFYFEIMNMNQKIINLAKELDIQVVATNEIYYTKKSDFESRNILARIGNTNDNFNNPDLYLKTPEEMISIFAELPEAIENTQIIVEKCKIDLELGDPTPPTFKFTLENAKNEKVENLPEPENRFSLENDRKLFTYLCKKGLEVRLEIIPESEHQRYKERLNSEMAMINGMKFPGYMLIVWDFVRYSESNNIPIGPGRGSAAGSLVAYSLRITDIDPMKYDLLFERFLNPDRISMPDIDMDFAQNRRKKIIKYVQDEYGYKNVSQVITFGTLNAKGVVRDVARVLNISYNDSNAFAKLIPNELNIKLLDAIEKEPKITAFINEKPEFKDVWKYSLALEGVKRNSGTHAAGLVISNDGIWEKTPIYTTTENKENFISQYSLSFLEDVDLIKFDFLGLKTLDVIYGAKKRILKLKNKNIDWNKINIDDKPVYKMLGTGKTIGIFQIESSGMQSLNSRMKPENFEDVIALIALYRPGPMGAGMLDDFVLRKNDEHTKIYYPFKETNFEKELKEVLDPTYGVIVYQEQVMKIVQIIGGFSLGLADVVRRVMGKKKDEEMKKYKAEFSQGAEAQGFNKEKAETLFDLIAKFAGYGFNKSHSAAYAMITFQTAYLKVHYPAEFFASLLSTENDNKEKIALYTNEARRLEIEIITPNINDSEYDFSVVQKDGKDAILFGFGAIGGVGESAIDSILEARKSGRFTDVPDFLNRVKVSKKLLESLIKVGAFEGMGYNRNTLLNGIDIVTNFSKQSDKIQNLTGSGSLFDTGSSDFKTNNKTLTLNPKKELSKKEILIQEKDLLHCYISGHPIDEFTNQIDKMNNISNIEDIEKSKNWQELMLVVIVEVVKIKISKGGNRFATVKLLDKSGEYETPFFSNTLEKFEELDDSVKNEAIGIKCQVKIDDEENYSIFVKSFHSLNEISEHTDNLKKGNNRKKKVKEVEKIETPKDIVLEYTELISQDTLFKIKNGAEMNSGHNPLFIYLKYNDEVYKINTGFLVNNHFL